MVLGEVTGRALLLFFTFHLVSLLLSWMMYLGESCFLTPVLGWGRTRNIYFSVVRLSRVISD